MLLVVFLFVLLLTLALFEAITHTHHVRLVPIRILVNGTRGKTTVSRQLYSALTSSGLRVLAKTTGSEAILLYPDGSEKPINRSFGYHLIREQYRFFSLAAKLKVDAVVVECSAVSPESQLLMAQKLVRPTVSIITNARIDHVDQMGSTKQSTADVLKLSVPEGQKFFTSDSFFVTDSQAIVVEDGNEELVKRVMTDLGFKDCTVGTCIPDIGLVGPFNVNGVLIVNAFAVNDKESASQILEQYKGQDYVVLYNNRADREFRVSYFAELFASAKVKRVYVLGEHVGKCVRFFSKHVPEAEVKPFDGSISSLNCKVAIGMGNIKGAGMEIVKSCMKEGSNA